MRVCYRELDGDYLCIETTTKDYYWQTQGKLMFEGRATAIKNQPSSICTTGISVDYLKDCYRLPFDRVPFEYAQLF